MTHTDPKAERGALLIALAAHFGARQGSPGVRAEAFLRTAREAVADMDDALCGRLKKLEDHLNRGASTADFADALGLQRGVSGYIYHTVPVALYSWLKHPGSFRSATEDVIALGGDTDSTGAVVGALAGATVGVAGIPEDWLNGLLEWPRSVSWMRELGARLTAQFPGPKHGVAPGPLPLFWPGLVPRNLVFLAVVLMHGFRRLLPPY